MKRAFQLLVATSILFLGACDHYSQKLAMLSGELDSSQGNIYEISPAAGGAGYEATLAQEYYMLAKYENEKMYDYTAAKYYTEKAVAASKGEKVEPGSVNQFRIDAEYVPELTKARQDLLLAMSADTEGANQGALAHAQTRYDCWLDQQEDTLAEGPNPVCKAQFYEAMAMIGGSSGETFVVPFVSGSADLSDAAKNVISEAVASGRVQNSSPMKLVGFSDGTSGDTATMERVSAVRSALQYNGVPSSAITVEIKGENRPMAPSEAADEAAITPINKVDIILQPRPQADVPPAM